MRGPPLSVAAPMTSDMRPLCWMNRRSLGLHYRMFVSTLRRAIGAVWAGSV
jgi:hypothetical protein